MSTTNQKGTFIVLAPILTVYLSAIVALTTPSVKKNAEVSPTSLTVPTGTTLQIEHATIQMREEKNNSQSSWGDVLTVIAAISVPVIGGAFAIWTAIVQERRLRIDSFNKSAELTRGDKVGQNEGAAVIFSLVKLGEYDFAIELIRTWWPSNKITNAAAVWALDKVFALGHGWSASTKKRRIELRDYAAHAFWINSHQLKRDDGSFVWPQSFEWEWPQFSAYCGKTMLNSFARMLVSRKWDEWNKRSLDSILTTLNIARKTDGNRANRYLAAMIQRGILRWYDKNDTPIRLVMDSKDLSELTREVDSTINEIETTPTEKTMPAITLIDKDCREAIEFMLSEGWKSGPKEYP